VGDTIDLREISQANTKGQAVPGTHVIRRQVLQVEFAGSEADAFVLERRLPELCRDWLTPAIERVLERSVPADEHWSIDRLEVDAGTFDPENLERDLIERVTEAIERLLRQRTPPADLRASSSTIVRRTATQSVQEAFLYFLRTGGLPWWFHLPAGKTLEEALRASWRAAGQTAGPPEHFARSTIDVMESPAVQLRLVRQFSADFLRALLARLAPGVATTLHQAFAELSGSDVGLPALRRFSEQLWQTAFAAAVAGSRPTAAALAAECLKSLPDVDRHQPALRERIAQIWPEALSRHGERATEAHAHTERPDVSRTAPAKGTKRKEPAVHNDVHEGVFINSAGLVLLHPFLPRLFDALGIAADDRLVQPERALCLLHFLATGQRVAPEYELILPKLLCNVPLEAPVDSRIELTAAEEAEALALLEAVVRNWDALGDTSPDGLRGTFLTRPGKLSRRDDGDDVLQVEARSFDILLDRLPWGIGMIKLPWMERILRVEWA